jgi:hypothetical protein
VFHHGESTGIIEVDQLPQDELARLAIDAPLNAARAAIRVQRAFWKLFSGIYGSGRAA